MNDLSQNKPLSKNTKIELDGFRPVNIDLDTLNDPIYTTNSIDRILRMVKWVGAKKSCQIGVKCQSGFDVSILADGSKVDRSLNFSRLMCDFVADIELQALDVGYSFKLVNVLPVIDDAEILINICRLDNGSLIKDINSVFKVRELPESSQNLIQDKLKGLIFRNGLERALYQAVSDSLKCDPVISKNEILHQFNESNYKLILDDLAGQDSNMWLGRSLVLLEIAKNAIPHYKYLTDASDLSIYDFKCLLSLEKLHKLWHSFGDEKLGEFLNSLPGFDPVYAEPGLQSQKTTEQFGFLSMFIFQSINNLSYENKWLE